MMTRRQALKTTALATAAAAASTLRLTRAQPAPNPTALAHDAEHPYKPTQPLITSASGPFSLPSLPYAFDALEPHIDARTMEIHHDKHHAAYVANLNKALVDSLEQPPGFSNSIEDMLKDLKAVPEKIRTTIRNNGGGHYNHSLFWQMMKKGGGGEPQGDLAKAIEKSFGSFGAFKENFAKAALGQFGSGWAWLVLDGKELKLEPAPNQDSPISQGRPPLLGVDVWEHAYYLKYQNKRADYVAAWWNVVNWDFVAERYAKFQA